MVGFAFTDTAGTVAGVAKHWKFSGALGRVALTVGAPSTAAAIALIWIGATIPGAIAVVAVVGFVCLLGKEERIVLVPLVAQKYGRLALRSFAEATSAGEPVQRCNESPEAHRFLHSSLSGPERCFTCRVNKMRGGDVDTA